MFQKLILLASVGAVGTLSRYWVSGLVASPTPATVHAIHALKREMVYLRKSVWPLREVISGLQRADSALVQPGTAIYLRDVYDHTIQAMDTVETYRDSNRMNEVMKVLSSRGVRHELPLHA